MIHRRHGFDPSTLDHATKTGWLTDLRDGAKNARQIADQCDEAVVRLGGQLKHPTASQFFQALRADFLKAFAAGMNVDEIFDQLEREAGERG